MNRLLVLTGSGLILGGSFAGGIWIGVKYRDEFRHGIEKLTGMTKKRPSVATNSSLLEKAQEIVKDCGEYAVLSTCNNDKVISTRIIQPLPLHYDDVTQRPVIFFHTSLLSQKVHDMKSNPEISLTYLNLSKLAYVNFKGRVEKIPFPESTVYWHESMRLFYPDGNNEPEGASFSVWKVVPHHISVVDLSRNICSVRKDFRSPELRFDEAGKRWEIICDGTEDP